MTGRCGQVVDEQQQRQQQQQFGTSIKKLAKLRDKRKLAGMSHRQQKTQVYVVGSPSPKSPFLRIAHVSDTCDAAYGQPPAYPADVLVHSGNICQYRFSDRFFRAAEFHNHVKAVNDYFARQPHRYKIFVPGPNEILFEAESPERMQALLPNCIYLQDSGCTIEGVRFYGTPWGAGRRPNVGRGGFVKSPAELKTIWSNVPDNVDVLVSHSLPASSLYEELVTRVRPRLFLFGSRPERAGKAQEAADSCVKFKDSVIFANGHPCGCRRGVFDFYADWQAPRDTLVPVVSPQAASEALRSLPLGSRPMLLRCIFS